MNSSQRPSHAWMTGGGCDLPGVEAALAGVAERSPSGSAWQAAAGAGVDMELLEHSLSPSPWERLRENQRALGLVLALEEAGRKLRERSVEHP